MLEIWGKEIPNRDRVHCNICGQSLAYGGTTSSLRTHMRHKHLKVWEEAENARREKLDSLDRHESIVHPDSETKEDDHFDSIEYIMKTETDDLIEEVASLERNDLAVSLSEDTNVNIDGEKKINPEDVINVKPGTLCWKFFHFKEQKKEDGKRILERAYCNICEKSMAYAGTTSTLNGHMRHIHQKLWEEAVNAQKGKNH